MLKAKGQAFCHGFTPCWNKLNLAAESGMVIFILTLNDGVVQDINYIHTMGLYSILSYMPNCIPYNTDLYMSQTVSDILLSCQTG